MGKAIASIFLGFILTLGGLSVQLKAFSILDHVATDHHDEHGPVKKDHHHDSDLASLSPSLGLPNPESFFVVPRIDVSLRHAFLMINESGLLSFSSSIFRPPIA